MVQSNNFTRTLRRKLTPEEKKLWFLLKDRRFRNYKFRRQVLIDSYIVDFCCFERRLVIEVDGSQHNDILRKGRDERRDLYLKSQGFTVLRLWNSDITDNGQVLELILRALMIDPSSGLRPPSPAGGEGERK